MNILLTNDDGIHAPGLAALVRTLASEHEVFVAAPEYEQSAVGHAITLADPIKVKPISKNGEFFGYALGGTPADCVKLASCELMDRRPDLVVSGINLGANVGINLLYSGTVSAATEAAILGLPALAISLDTFRDPDFSSAADLARRLAAKLPELAIPPGVSLNVNVPALPAAEIKGLAWARQGQTPFGERFTRRIDPRGNVYYWRGSERSTQAARPDSDYALLAQGYATITPLRHDLTHHRELIRLKNINIDL
ncbi:MAG: 5'/3'-nucleotidase SurE [Proteobacteria bacterium]|nr:5'/3'-nucleotidase SurE [Pseudomonadota bacterium]